MNVEKVKTIMTLKKVIRKYEFILNVWELTKEAEIAKKSIK